MAACACAAGAVAHRGTDPGKSKLHTEFGGGNSALSASTIMSARRRRVHGGCVCTEAARMNSADSGSNSESTVRECEGETQIFALSGVL
ncbi:hypothetical protein CYMTET_36007 [Cymbomonas tetramitiformis]|uniref:Uncharacterized protein n=1 Tax=Cymbomonas tetramitiformis TaxID=36881 RepID=A0AAE0KN07_9CHLO|nr:hypothetical protein CYMTET_36007 [Cymbomonas tetramitiformis]